MKNSEESDEDVADSAVWSSLIGNIVAIIISAYLWLLQQNPNRKYRRNFNPDQLNNALKDLKHMAQELTKQNEIINESQCKCDDETADGTEIDKVKNVKCENKDKTSESVLTVNSVKNNTQEENKNSDKNDPHEKICDICIECLNNAISSETTTSLKTSPIDQEYRPYQEPEFAKKSSKSKKYDKSKIKKGIADAQRAIQYLQRIQDQFESNPTPKLSNKFKGNYDKVIKKANFQEYEVAKRQNRTVIKYDSDFLDETMPDDYCVECSSSCSIVKYETIAKPNPNNQNNKLPQQPDTDQSYDEKPQKRNRNKEQNEEVRNGNEENCTFMEDPCDPCERLKPQLDNNNYAETTSKSSENEVVEQEEETCAYMENPCKPCEVKPNVPINRLPPTARKIDPRKAMNYTEGGRVAGCPMDGRPCFVEKCSHGVRQPNVTAPVYQNGQNGNRNYGQRPKSPRPPIGGNVPQNYRQPVYPKIPVSDNGRQDYQMMYQRLSPRGNYVNPKYEKAMNTLTVERIDACSETGEFLQSYNQYPMNNQQFVNQMQQKQFENQQARQREFAKFKRPVMIQQKQEVDYRHFPQNYQEVRYRNEDLPLMPVAAIPLKSSSNTLDVSKCPRYLK